MGATSPLRFYTPKQFVRNIVSQKLALEHSDAKLEVDGANIGDNSFVNAFVYAVADAMAFSLFVENRPRWSGLGHGHSVYERKKKELDLNVLAHFAPKWEEVLANYRCVDTNHPFVKGRWSLRHRRDGDKLVPPLELYVQVGKRVIQQYQGSMPPRDGAELYEAAREQGWSVNPDLFRQIINRVPLGEHDLP